MSTWYDELQTAMNQREIARKGVARWEAKVAKAEETIAKLLADSPAAASTPETPVPPAALFSGIAEDYADSAE